MTNLKPKSEDKTAFKHSKVDELFNLIKEQKTGKVIICVGNNKVSKKQFQTYKEADKYIASKPYEILVNVSVLIFKSLQDEKSKQIDKTNKAEPKGN